MKNRYIFPLIAFGLVFVMIVYFLLHPSYQKSLEAKYYYEMGDYKTAYTLANEAFSMDLYNRMAATIMAQSKTSMKYQEYIQQAKQYLKEINAMAAKETLSDADRARIKMMSQIVVDSYKKLAPSVITDKALVKEAEKYYKNFEKLLEKVDR
jgi:tRNA U34 5-carboxymethylaminomethyl modifying enzyme MnmG/GidA